MQTSQTRQTPKAKGFPLASKTSRRSKTLIKRRRADTDFDPARIKNKAFTYYQRLGRVDSYLRSHISEPLGLSQAAEIAGLESTYFSAYFHRKTGVRFHQWTGYVRVEQAKDLLRARAGSMRQICFTVGFKDMRTFQRNFRRFAGMSPSEFRGAVGP